VPVLFVAAGEITHRRPDVGEALFAAHLLQNGLVVPLITLSFSTFVLLPLVIASVTGYAIAGKSQAIP
jgi:hypothetical protein